MVNDEPEDERERERRAGVEEELRAELERLYGPLEDVAEELRRFPPDAPVVPNDRWVYRDPPPRCAGRRRGGVLLAHLGRRHRWTPELGMPTALRCQRCGLLAYDVPSSKWGPRRR